MGRCRSFSAQASPTMRSVAGSQVIFRPVAMATRQRCPMLAERWATSAGVIVVARFFTQSMNWRQWPGLFRRISPGSMRLL